MKAAVFKAVGEPLAIETVPDPTPGPGEFVLRVGRCGICGSDLHMTDGHGPTYARNTVIGHEFSGVVVALGRGVDNFKIGDHVAAMPFVGCGHCGSCLGGEPAWCDEGAMFIAGGMGQYALAKAHAAIKLPRSLTVEDGALIEPLAVSLHGVTLAELKPGSRVLVLGTGAIGLGTVYWARRLGAERVVASSRSRRGEALAMQLGATHFASFGEDFAEQVKAALGGQPDIVFECIGRPGMLALAVDLVRARGSVVLLGSCTVPDSIIPVNLMVKQLRLQGSMIYSVREFETVAEVFDAGHVEPRAMITDTVGFDSLPAAFEALRKPSGQCKLMVDPWRSG